MEDEVKNKVPFEKTGPFTDEYEIMVREMTNPNGGHNSAFRKESQDMLPQTKLKRVHGWTFGLTGMSVMFEWESGRTDAYCVVDIENPNNLPHVHEQLIKKAS